MSRNSVLEEFNVNRLAVIGRRGGRYDPGLGKRPAGLE